MAWVIEETVEKELEAEHSRRLDDKDIESMKEGLKSRWDGEVNICLDNT